MQIVINISDYKYEKIKEDAEKFRSKEMVVPYLYKVIESGTPLPKGHGRLIDADELYDSLIFPTEQFARGYKGTLDDAPTIIEADKAESEDKE